MTATFAIVLAVLSLGSCFACYQLGRDSMRQEIKAVSMYRRYKTCARGAEGGVVGLNGSIHFSCYEHPRIRIYGFRRG